MKRRTSVDAFERSEVNLARPDANAQIGIPVTPAALDAALVPAVPPFSRSYRRRTLFVLLAVGLVLLGWWGSGYVLAYTDDAFLTSNILLVTSEVSGPIATVDVKDNEWVTRGRLLLEIDPVPFRLAVQQARANEARAEAKVHVDQAQVGAMLAGRQASDTTARLAMTNLQRDAALARSGFLSAQALDRSQTTEEQSDAQRHEAEIGYAKAMMALQLDGAAIASAHAGRLRAEWRLSRTKIVTPVTDYVTHLAVDKGDMVSPDQPVIAVVDHALWHVMAKFKEYYLRHLRPGHIAWIWLDSEPWHFYRARIQGLADGISRERGNDGIVPSVSPTVGGIRLQRRIPVRFTLLHPPSDDLLFMGADAGVLVIY